MFRNITVLNIAAISSFRIIFPHQGSIHGIYLRGLKNRRILKFPHRRHLTEYSKVSQHDKDDKGGKSTNKNAPENADSFFHIISLVVVLAGNEINKKLRGGSGWGFN